MGKKATTLSYANRVCVMYLSPCHPFQMRLTGDYSDSFGLTEDDVVPNVKLTEDFVNQVTTLAREKILNQGPVL